MRGRNHLFVTLLLILPIIFSLINSKILSIEQSFLLTLGVFFGSLLPDIDSHSSMIKGSKISGFDFFISRFSPIIAFITTWFIFIPSSVFLRGEKHRELMHSLLGLILIFVGWSIIFYIIYSVFNISFELIFLFYLFVPGLIIGSFFHLIEDSLTKEGVRFFFPNKFRFKGRIKTGTILEDVFFGFFAIGCILVFSFSTSIAITILLTIVEILLIYLISYPLSVAFYGEL